MHTLSQVALAAQDHVQRALPAGRGPHLLVDPDDATIEALVNRKTKPPKYVYDDSELLDAVVARAADQRKVDPATGEVLERPEDAVTRVLQDVYGLTGKQARSTHLEKYGIAMKDYRSVQRPTKLEVVK